MVDPYGLSALCLGGLERKIYGVNFNPTGADTSIDNSSNQENASNAAYGLYSTVWNSLDDTPNQALWDVFSIETDILQNKSTGNGWTLSRWNGNPSRKKRELGLF